MGLKDPAKSAKMFQVTATSTEQTEVSETEEPLDRRGRGEQVDQNALAPPSANTSQEEEEIEMDDEDFYNKMRRREEYMKRRELLTTEEGGEDMMEQTSSTPSSPGITPQPMMPVGRLPPIQLQSKGKRTKKKKKAREGSIGALNTDESTMEGGQMEETTFGRTKKPETPTCDPDYETIEDVYEEVNVLKGSTYENVKMLDEEVEPFDDVKVKKRRRKRDLSWVDRES